MPTNVQVINDRLENVEGLPWAGMHDYGPSTFIPTGPSMHELGMQPLPIGSQRRAERYKMYPAMCKELPPLRRAIDIRTETALQPDTEAEEVLGFVSPGNSRVAGILYRMSERTALAPKLACVLSEVIELGDFFMQNEIAENNIVGLYREAPELIEAIVDLDRGVTIGYRVSPHDYAMAAKAAEKIFALWQLLHVKRNPFAVYGTSDLDTTEYHVKKYQWMQFAALRGRIYHSEDRLVEMVDVTDIKGDEKKIQERLKARQSAHEFARVMDASGRIRSVRGELPWGKPIMSPVMEGGAQEAGVKVLQGQKGLEQVGDLVMVREEALSVLGVPLRHLGLGRSDTTLAEAEVRDLGLIRLGLRDQTLLLDTLIYPLCEIELALNGLDTRQRRNTYTARMKKLIVDEEKVQATILEMKSRAYQMLKASGDFDPAFMMRMVFKMSDDDIENQRKYVEQARVATEVAESSHRLSSGSRDWTETADLAKLTFLSMILDEEIARRSRDGSPNSVRVKPEVVEVF